MTGLPGQLQERVAVLTDEIFLVVAGDVVPDHAVGIEVVQHGQTGLVVFALHQELSVVRLWLSGSPCRTPGSRHPTLSTAQPHLRTRSVQAFFSLGEIYQDCALIGLDDVDDAVKPA